MKVQAADSPVRGWPIFLLCATLTATLLYFFVFHDWRPASTRGRSLVVSKWLWIAWNSENHYWRFWWLTLIALGVAITSGVRRGKNEPAHSEWTGLLWLTAGLLFWAWGDRSQQIRFTCMSFPLLLFGGVHFVLGWKRARHFLFALLVFVFLVPLPVEQWVNQLWKPADRLTEVFFTWIGGLSYSSHHGMWGMVPRVNFHYLIPVFLTCLFMARYLHKSVWCRVLILIMLPPVLILTEAQRAAGHARLREMDISLDWIPGQIFEVCELLAMMALSATYFSLSFLFRRRPARVSSEIMTAA